MRRWIALWSTCVPAAVRAAGEGAAAPLPGVSLVELSGALALVIGAILLAAWALRRLNRFSPNAGGLRVVGGLTVGPRERLLLVETGTTRLLVGVAPGRVSAVHVLPEGAAVEGVSSSTPAAVSFPERLRAALGQGAAR